MSLTTESIAVTATPQSRNLPCALAIATKSNRARPDPYTPVSRGYERSPNKLRHLPPMNASGAKGRAQPSDGSASRPYQGWKNDEFAPGVSEWTEGLSRRE